MTRLARAYRQAPADFWCRVWPEPGMSFQEIDRRPPEGLLQLLSSKTGTPYTQAVATTLAAYEQYSMPSENASGNGDSQHPGGSLYYRTCRGDAIRFCPQRLAEDAHSYFRRQWRLAFVTVCEHHGVRLHEECVNCGASVRYEKITVWEGSLASCYRCGQDLRRMAAAAMPRGESSTKLSALQQRLLEIIEPVEQAATSREGKSLVKPS